MKESGKHKIRISVQDGIVKYFDTSDLCTEASPKYWKTDDREISINWINRKR